MSHPDFHALLERIERAEQLHSSVVDLLARLENFVGLKEHIDLIGISVMALQGSVSELRDQSKLLASVLVNEIRASRQQPHTFNGLVPTHDETK